MITQPKQPSKPGGVFEYLRQTAQHTQQRGAAGFGGMMTTKGFIPNRTRRSKPQPAAPESEDPRWS